jgi:hypothetical protein
VLTYLTRFGYLAGQAEGGKGASLVAADSLTTALKSLQKMGGKKNVKRLVLTVGQVRVQSPPWIFLVFFQGLI